MFTRFKSYFIQDAPVAGLRSRDLPKYPQEPRLEELLLQFSGASFNCGLYRVMDAGTLLLGQTFIADAFPDFANRVMSFSYDWLGRIFALDFVRFKDRMPSVVMLEPGTGQVLEIPCNLISFHESELINNSERSLAENFHKRWLEMGGQAPKKDQCIAYKKQLFLGGEDVMENLEISDLKVYWHLSGQLIQKTRALSSGTRLGKIELND